MSPVSRRRKNEKSRRSDQRILRTVPAVPQECDCPECSDPDFDPQAVIDDLAAGIAGILAVDDPLEAELYGANFVAAGESAGEGFAEALSEAIVPALAQMSTPASLGVLLAIDAMDGGGAAAVAGRRLLARGLPAPAWMDALSEPVKGGVCRRYRDRSGEASMLLCSFERSGRSHGFLIDVDHTDCDAAVDIMLFPGEALDEVGGMVQTDARRAGVRIDAEDLDPAELRWQVERALDARAVHDRESGGPEPDDGFDEAGPGYHPLAVLLRTRMGVLPEPPRPPAEHGAAARPGPMFAGRARQVQAAAATLPAKRKKSDGPAPIYQIKVGLRGAKPPIWRRLEVPGDTSLSELHDIIQVAFGWDGSHLHVFETPYGMFGVADRELGHRAEKPVTLEQVAPDVRGRVRYVYDFGDNWEHEIVVEKLLDRRAAVAYPRCTAGRRAAPPDDCGGIRAYAQLVDVLADPAHPEHGEHLEWLGLASAGEFEPALFDAAEVSRALTVRG
ncbi:plasmid pRiA4b ORF-3 family protein [Actinoplanes sp. NPDC026623]|uniref:plasmid pRiA4b ORF-3 family protein n=1 Tax=Actinoplanes sp. NPDC026623 TaxID=3155610 RepID=UPI0033C24AF3